MMRVLLADRRPRVRFALRTLLGRQMGLEIAGEAVDAEDLIAEVKTTCPDVVLLDWRLRGRAVTDLVHTLRRMCPDLYVIILSGRPEERPMALAAGADAFVSKVDPPESLLAAIRSVQRVDAALTSLVAQTLGVF